MLDEQSLVQTYNPPSYADPWQQVEDWRRVRRYVGRFPDKGRVTVGNALELPPERVRGWLDGGKPDAVHGLHIAENCGWLHLDPDGPKGRQLALCIIGIFACGTAGKRWVPAWSPSTATTEHLLWNAVTELGVHPRHCHPRHCHTAPSSRPQELTVGDDGMILGRCLVAAGAPRGGMNPQNSPASPSWLFEASTDTRSECAKLFLLERGTTFADKDPVSIQTKRRSAAYRESLRRLFKSITEESVTVGTNVTVSAAAARELNVGRGQAIRQ